jgi:hypothetical protein
MKKFFLFIFILVDAAVVGVCVLFLYSRMHSASGTAPFAGVSIPGLTSTTAAPPPANTSAATPAAPAPSAQPPAASPAAASANAAARKILFQYRNSKARKVMIRADFTGWRAEPMQKDPATSTWKYTGVLEPGEYAYCFSVDDKSIRDPANKRTKQVGKTFVSSIIVSANPAAKP